MRRAISSIFVLFLLGLGVWYAVGRLSGEKTPPVLNDAPPPPPLTYATKPEIGFLAPDFLLETLEGRAVRLSDFLGKYVIIDFWSTRCPFCLTELRNFNRLIAENPNKLVIVAINRGEEAIIVDNFLNNYLHPSNIIFVMDLNETVYRRYRGSSMPESFFIDTSGVIRDHNLGELTYDEMKERMRQLFESTTAAPE